MAIEDLSKTGLVTTAIKDPLPDSADQELTEEPIGFIPAERASTSVVAEQTEVNPLAADLPDTQLMNALTEYSGINFDASLMESPIIGSASYMSYKRDATTGEVVPEGNFSDSVDLYQGITDAINQEGKTEQYKALTREPYDDYRNRLKMQGPMDYMNEMGTIMAGQEPYETYDFLSTEDFAESFKKDTVVGNPTKPSLFNKITSVPTGVYGAGKMVWNMLTENHFIKGVKNNPDKYMGNPKYVNDAEKWFEKQGQEQFGAIFEENPESAIKVAQANKAIYDYLNSTIDGQKKIQEMGLNKNSIDTQLEKANAFETAANLKAESYSAYQGDYSGSAEGVAAKKQVYANMSDNELNNNMAAGADQYSGMAIGGPGVYVDISDGIASGTKFKSGTIFVKWKKEEREERAKEEKEEEVVKTTKQDNQKDSGSGNQQGSGGGGGPVGMVGSPTKPRPRTGPDLTTRQLGGPIGNPMGQQQQAPVQDVGNLELVQEQGKDMSGVADDVSRELDEGDFVINAPAVEMAGRGDIERMVTKAITELQRKGVKLDFGQAAEDADSIVQALVSNKEMIIPKVIAEQIGYDRLEKINNRGKQRVEEIEQQQQQQQQGFIQGNPQAVQMGGQIALDENKNQPIAVPRESFAGQSSVGRKLLSPLSPESQNDEKELQEKSQSFEGFLKPLKMNKGDKIKPKLKPKPILNNEEQVYRVFKNQNIIQEGTEPYKLRPEAIAGIMGNIAVETGNTFDYKTQQLGGGPGQGLFQFEGGHWNEYEKYKKDKNIAPSASAQISYVLDNIFNGTGFNIGAKNRMNLIRILSNGSAEEVADAFAKLFERPNPEGAKYDERKNRANEIFNKFNNKSLEVTIPLPYDDTSKQKFNKGDKVKAIELTRDKIASELKEDLIQNLSDKQEKVTTGFLAVADTLSKIASDKILSGEFDVMGGKLQVGANPSGTQGYLGFSKEF